MIEQLDTKKIILKTKQYEFSDGLRDIQLGIMFILMAVVWFWLMYEPALLRFTIQLGRDYGKWASSVTFLFIFFIPVVAAVGVQRIMETIRRRWLWRESGMVKSSQIVVPPHISILAGVLFIAIIVLGLKFQSALKTGDFYIMSLVMMASGWCSGVITVGLGMNIKVTRYTIIGVLGGLASTAALLYQSSLFGAGLFTFIGWGVLLIISGVIVLVQVWPDIKEENHDG
ncbi:MAG: hypothetical protein PVF83_10395 [Anaerolineales bacterium]|jgi:hypothetical protein